MTGARKTVLTKAGSVSWD